MSVGTVDSAPRCNTTSAEINNSFVLDGNHVVLRAAKDFGTAGALKAVRLVRQKSHIASF